MDIKAKDTDLIYLACIIFSELDKLDKNSLALKTDSLYDARLQHILSLKNKWVELMLNSK